LKDKIKQYLFKNLEIKIHINIILPLLLYRYKTWSLTLREENKLMVFEKRVSRRTFGHERDEVMEGKKKTA
jgi:hypothetical protein